MRFAITATDRYIGVFEALVAAGWEPIKLFTTLVDNRIHRHQSVIQMAQRLNLDVQFSRLCESDLRDLSHRGCDLLVIASYAWRIGNWRPYLQYAINFHPSPLPEGRGPYPSVQAILEQRPYWGVSCHKLTHDFDGGDLLDQECFPLGEQECHESLDLRVQMAAGRLALRVADHFTELWDNAKPQEGGSYSPHWTHADRTIHFAEPVEKILLRIRAFGLIESIAVINDVTLFVKRAVGWVESHPYQSGTQVYVNNRSLVVAASDGFIGIVEWSLLDPALTTKKEGM